MACCCVLPSFASDHVSDRLGSGETAYWSDCWRRSKFFVEIGKRAVLDETSWGANRGVRLQQRCTEIFLFHRAVPFDTAAILLEGTDKSISVSIIYPKSPYHLEQSERQPFLEKCLQAIPFDAQSDGAQNSVIERIPAA